jgi:hypothetical protein
MGGYGRPGVIPLRPLTVGEMLDGAVTAIRFNPRVMLGLSAIVAVVSQLVQVLIAYTVLARLEDFWLSDPATVATLDQQALYSLLGQSLAVLFLTALVSAGAVLVLTGVLTAVVSRAVLGQRIEAGAAWAMVRPTLGRLVGVMLLIGAGAFAAVVVAILPLLVNAEGLAVLLLLVVMAGLVYALVRLSLSGAVVVLERCGVRAALGRSWALVAGAWWRTFGVLALSTIITAIVGRIFELPFGLLAGDSLTDGAGHTQLWPLLMTTIGAIVGATFTWPFAAAVTVLLYVDRRIRREGLDLELARAAGLAPGDGGQ